LARRWRQAWIWGVLAAICLVLALGPILKVGGKSVVYTVDGCQTEVVLPYALVKSLPIVGASRTPGRINETTSFALAVLAAFGFDALPRWSTKQWRSFILAFVLAIGIVFETLVRWPLPLNMLEIPRVVRTIAAEDDTGALLHVPSFSKAKFKNLALYYQTLHGRPIVGGWVHRSLPEAQPWETTFYGLVRADQAEGDIVPRPSLAQRRAWLRYFDIDYIILSKEADEEDVREYRPLVEGLIGAVTDEDDAVAAFAVPTDVAFPTEPLLYTVGRKWTSPFQNQDGTWGRWVRGSGRIYVYATEAQRVRIVFAVDSALDLADLALEVDGASVDRFVVGERSTYVSRSLAWERGMHTILFTRVQGCEDLSPDEFYDCKVFALENVRVVSESELPREAALDVDLADLVHLTGYALDTLAFRPGGTLTVTLKWRAVEPLQENFVVFTHLLNEEGVLVAQWDAEPADGRFPTSAWPEGSTFGHSVSLQLPADLPPGNYRLLVGMYRWPSLERLDIPENPEDVYELGEFVIWP
jgi:hypothetical protein